MASFSDDETPVVADEAQTDPAAAVSDEARDSVLQDTRSPAGFGEWLRGLFFGSPDQRLDDLTDAIEENPAAPANYVLRGEVLMDIGEYELAAGDFEHALTLAAAQFEEEDWGLLSQTMRDQAAHSLERARRKLARKGKRQSYGEE